MTETQQLHEDLRFVRRAAARRVADPTPRAIAWMWGAFILVAFALLDFNLRVALWLFAVGAPLLGVASGVVGAMHGRRHGEVDRRAGKLHVLHWGTIFLGMLALVVLAAKQRVSGEGVGQIATLIVGIVYFLAGVHLDRRWMPSGLLLIIGSAAITFVPRYPWTVLGVVVSLAVVLPTFLPQRSDEL
jgi:hypothetical protein